MFSRKYELLFYIAVGVIVVILLYPDFVNGLVDDYVNPEADKLAEAWLKRRGLDFSKEEKVSEWD